MPVLPAVAGRQRDCRFFRWLWCWWWCLLLLLLAQHAMVPLRRLQVREVPATTSAGVVGVLAWTSSMPSSGVGRLRRRSTTTTTTATTTTTRQRRQRRLPLLVDSPTMRSSSSSFSSLAVMSSSSSSSSVQDDIPEKEGSFNAASAAAAGGGDYFEAVCRFLREQQSDIIRQLEDLEDEYYTAEQEYATASAFTKTTTNEPARFGCDAWGSFANSDDNDNETGGTGGLTRVMQNGAVVEKGACSFTVIRNGILSAERAAAMTARQQKKLKSAQANDETTAAVVRAGDSYCAAALSVVLHSRHPAVPTFRSDVRIFCVDSNDEDSDDDSAATASTTATTAWLGGGADLTPYYLYEDDIRSFHRHYRDLCDRHKCDYNTMKRACDEYFYLPARRERRGTGGIFFDDVTVTDDSTQFCYDLVRTWMSSWMPIVNRRQHQSYSAKQKQWQCLRRGRYLEFNLLYDRGVRFGLVGTASPRVEAVLVSAPPEIRYDYEPVVADDSPEHHLVSVLTAEPAPEWV